MTKDKNNKTKTEITKTKNKDSKNQKTTTSTDTSTTLDTTLDTSADTSADTPAAPDNTIDPDTMLHQKILQTSLAALTDDVLYVAFELRLMAAAQGPYAPFTTASPHIKNLLQTAATLLEESRTTAPKNHEN